MIKTTIIYTSTNYNRYQYDNPIHDDPNHSIRRGEYVQIADYLEDKINCPELIRKVEKKVTLYSILHAMSSGELMQPGYKVAQLYKSSLLIYHNDAEEIVRSRGERKMYLRSEPSASSTLILGKLGKINIALAGKEVLCPILDHYDIEIDLGALGGAFGMASAHFINTTVKKTSSLLSETLYEGWY